MEKTMKELKEQVMPAGPLMREHRLIERMIAVLKKETERLASDGDLDMIFIKETADFMRTYADECHHGKEENILFRELGKKEISKNHSETMNQLIAEHKYGRKILEELLEADYRYEKGDKKAKVDVLNRMKALVEFYPRHIEKEDKYFFLPCMEYFSREEKDDMLEEFRSFDRTLIHRRYGRMVGYMERFRNVV